MVFDQWKDWPKHEASGELASLMGNDMTPITTYESWKKWPVRGVNGLARHMLSHVSHC